MEIETIVASLTAFVGLGSLALLAYRERREGTARAEQRAKAIIDLLRIAENLDEPEVVRQFARQELGRLRAQLVPRSQEDALVERVFGSRPLEAANVQLAQAGSDDPKVMDEDLQRLVGIVRWWAIESTPQQAWRVRSGFMIALFALGFLLLAIGATRAALTASVG